MQAVNKAQFAILAVVLHLHTRFDMCEGCSYSLDWELQDSQGFKSVITKRCEGHNSTHGYLNAPICFGVLVSSRENYLTWGIARRTLNNPPPFNGRKSPEAAYQQFQEIPKLEDMSSSQEGIEFLTCEFYNPQIEEFPGYKASKTDVSLLVSLDHGQN